MNEDPTDARRLLDELSTGERAGLDAFAHKIKTATVAIAHPDDLAPCRELLDAIGRADLKLLPDARLERGTLYAIDKTAFDSFLPPSGGAFNPQRIR